MTPATPSANSASPADASARSKVILVVNDQASLRMMVGVTLRQARYEIIESPGAEEALGYARNHPVDLVLVDLYMPRMNGIELIQALRALPSYRLTPILMLTTESSPYRKLEAKQAGAMGWIVKPFKPNQLLFAVERALGNPSLTAD